MKKISGSLFVGCVTAVVACSICGATDGELFDVTFPGDPNSWVSSHIPVIGGPYTAFDNDLTTKYLNFDRVNTGFTVTPRIGLTVVRGLTLTSADDAPDRDPTSYTLEGSYDGRNFTPIASGVVPPFPTRFHQHSFRFENDVPYLVYRLIFPTINGSSCCIQIAEVELLGERGPRDVTRPGDAIIGATPSARGSIGVPNAIDNDPRTKYLNFDIVNTGFKIDPHLGPTILGGLTLTSADDAPERDPTAYVLEGTYNGLNFTRIANGAVPPFPSRSYKQTFLFKNTAPFLSYRLLFPTVNGSACCMQIAEVELLAEREIRDITTPGMPLAAIPPNPPGSYSLTNAIDDTPSIYITEDLVNTGLIVTPSVGPTVVTGLSVTSSGEPSDRDPTSYALEGSTDGTNFASIRRGSVPPFLSFYQKNYIFFPENTNSYRWYRLSFPTANGSTCCVQFAEIELLGRGPELERCPSSEGQLIREHPVDAFVWPGFRATFRVVLADPARVQWYRNGQRIPGATGETYVTPPTTAADEGARFHAVVEAATCERSIEATLRWVLQPPGERIGFNWIGGMANAAPTEMPFDDIVGVVEQGYWNNLAGRTGTMSRPLVNDGAPHPTISMEWQTSGVWGLGVGEGSPARRLFNGLVTSPYRNPNPAEASVTLTGVPVGSHSLLLYTVQPLNEFWHLDFWATTYRPNGAPKPAQYRFIRPLEIRKFIDPPNFLVVTGETAAARGVGNVVRFDALHPEDGRIEVRFRCPGPAPSGVEVPAVGAGLNGMQLLLHTQPVDSVNVRLSIRRSGDSTEIFWPEEATGFVLLGTPTLTPPAWIPVLGVVSNRVRLANPAGTTFFRLAK